MLSEILKAAVIEAVLQLVPVVVAEAIAVHQK